MAIEAELVRRLDGRPDDQPGPATLHGEAHGREDDRGQSKPRFAHIAARYDYEPDSGSGRIAVGRNLAPTPAQRAQRPEHAYRGTRNGCRACGWFRGAGLRR